MSLKLIMHPIPNKIKFSALVGRMYVIFYSTDIRLNLYLRLNRSNYYGHG